MKLNQGLVFLILVLSGSLSLHAQVAEENMPPPNPVYNGFPLLDWSKILDTNISKLTLDDPTHFQSERDQFFDDQLLQTQGPFIGGGGGEGIVCFSSRIQADNALWPSGKLKKSARKSITKVFSLDAAEHRINMPTRWPLKNESTREYLNRQLERTATYAPYFASKLASAVNIVLAGGHEVENWHSKTGLVKIDDSGKRFVDPESSNSRKIELNCKVVQLAIRHVVPSADRSLPPKVFVEYDKELYEKMGVSLDAAQPGASTFHKASLILHEALWLMGSMMGHSNSHFSRRLFQLLWAVESHQNQTDQTSDEVNANKYGMILFFLLYNHFEKIFEINLDQIGEVSSGKNILRASFTTLLEKLMNTSKKIKVLGENLIVDTDSFASPYFLKNLQPLLSNSESFLYTVYINYLAESSPYSPDYFLINGIDERPLGEWLCRKFENQRDSALRSNNQLWKQTKLFELYEQSLRYCRSQHWTRYQTPYF